MPAKAWPSRPSTSGIGKPLFAAPAEAASVTVFNTLRMLAKRQLACLQRLQRGLGDGLAQRLALLGGGLGKHGDQRVLVDA